MSQMSESKKTKSGKGRRTWTTLEEVCLLNALKDIVQLGMKCDNGFRSGYLGALEKAMALEKDIRYVEYLAVTFRDRFE